MRAMEWPSLSNGIAAPEVRKKTLRQRLGRHARRFIGHHLLGTVTHVITSAPVAALTFDDGPDPVSTPRLLDILERYNVRATFFMLGIHARKYPELVQRIARAGHCIANHSFDHPRFPMLTRRDRIGQIRACEVAIAPFGKKFFRPPRGLQSFGSSIDALLLGYRVVTWNVVIQDWEPHTPEWVADRLETGVKPGSIVLLHDVLYDADRPEAIGREPVFAGLDMFLNRNHSRFSFVTVPDLFGYGTPHHAGWFIKSEADWAFHDPS